MNDNKPDVDTIEDYLNGRLDDAAVERLELWLADQPEVLDDIQNELAIRTAAKELFAKKPLQKSKQSHRFLNGIKEKLIYTLLGAVAASTTTFFMLQKQQTLSIEANIPIVTLSHIRGTIDSGFNPVTTIELSKENSRVILVVQLTEIESSTYNVVLRQHQQEKNILTITDLKPFGMGDLQVAIPSSYLKPGNYWLDAYIADSRVESLPFSVD
ncbi:MAG: hypothetical protein KDI92_01320 [Xanthomonadales bacterium]|nr:hypothetical protein [Xanthomonadales bacterium]